MIKFPRASVVTSPNVGAVTVPGNTSSGNVKGNWTQWVASTAFRTDAIEVNPTCDTNQRALYDIAVGAPGSEQVIYSNIPVAQKGNLRNDMVPIILPTCIPAGSAISFRCQTSTANKNVYMRASLLNFGEAFEGVKATTYGADTSTSSGTPQDAGAAANTKSAYTQIVASTSDHILHLLVFVTNQHAAVTFFGTYDVAVGGAGSEQIIIPDVECEGNSTIETLSPYCWVAPVPIPSGTRLSVRRACSTTDTDGRIVDFTLVGIR